MRDGQPIAITPKAFDILLALVQSGGRVMTKEEMMSAAWPDCFVEEGNLAQNIFLLRRILGERKNEHKFIITIPGVGYRFAPYVMGAVADVTRHNLKHFQLSVQLVLTEAGSVVWAEEFDAEFASLFELRDALSEQVANALAERLRGVGQTRLSLVQDRNKTTLRRCS